MPEKLRKIALEYHELPRPGKLAIQITKATTTPEDLSLAYTPGVAIPVLEIRNNPENAYRYTSKGNLVAVITDGTAVLGLGNTGPLASKPVMEGKAVLFKRFADIDVFDIEVDAEDPDDFIDTVARIAGGFGGINLEDIAAPHCFYIEQELSRRLDIPVFHDDQHGTAIIIAAGILNALELQKKTLPDANIVCLGAGAAGVASMNLLIEMGAKREKIHMVDRQGIIHDQRENLTATKQAFAIKTEKRTLADACEGADIFIGVSGPDLLSSDMLLSMAPRPIVFALSNPVPEILPELANQTRNDLVMATGRSDYPNQVNNVLGFPFIFRGTLDVRAACINTEMHIAAAHALADLGKQPVLPEIAKIYGYDSLEFGPDNIIPKPFDPRLIDVVPKAVAQAAIDSGVARLDLVYKK
ncbi:MAG TPA: malate dehydrogenase [Gammaproteobacteria bacterium]|nr:NADP-dependent malic enzyme [bacterium BMS3Abin11]GMT40753.1 MAG: malic enzyme [bacterium]HDH08585.1 malate dehydrogenase [Gammaproteobacteria bacterium]HDH17185.1 malate dehydrogenase [Gammaproteobacteria bacterium]HDZ79289.1 malate dehydrogenase [Gammaproteobacteria bacterium]